MLSLLISVMMHPRPKAASLPSLARALSHFSRLLWRVHGVGCRVALLLPYFSALLPSSCRSLALLSLSPPLAWPRRPDPCTGYLTAWNGALAVCLGGSARGGDIRLYIDIAQLPNCAIGLQALAVWLKAASDASMLDRVEGAFVLSFPPAAAGAPRGGEDGARVRGARGHSTE
jgi:hypothetical protein